MNSPPHNWQHWQPQFHLIDTERRLTETSKDLERHDEIIQDIENDHSATKKKIAFHERLLIGIGVVLQIVLQDKYPFLAQFIKTLLHQ